MKRIFTLFAVTCLTSLTLYGPTEELFGAYNFTIEIEGINAGAFQEVSGLGAEIEVIEYQNGEDIILRKRPGRVKYGDITLKRGYIGDSPVLEWFQFLTTGQIDPRSMSIILRDEAGGELGRWNLYGCWPKAWRVAGVSTGGMTLVEEIDMAVEEVLYEPTP